MKQRWVCAILAGAATGLGATGAQAQVQVSATGAARHESNLFRLPDDVETTEGRSDDIFDASGTIVGHFHPDDYNVDASATVGHEWFRRNSDLDNTNYSAEVNASRTGSGLINLTFDALSERRLSSFSDVRLSIRNVQSIQRVTADAAIAITPDIRFVVDPSFLQNKNSADIIKPNDYRQYGLGLGLGYYSPVGNSVAVTVSRTYTDGLEDRPVVLGDGSVVNSPIDLVDTALNLRLRYSPSVVTSISGNLSYVSRHDRSLLGSDYHGPAGDVTIQYVPRETLRFTLQAGRRLDAQTYVFIDSLRTDFINLSGMTRLLDRFDLTVSADYYHRRFDFDPIATFLSGDRTENTYRLSAQVGYRVLDRVDLVAGTDYEHRDSNVEFGDYTAAVVRLSANVLFGRPQ